MQVDDHPFLIMVFDFYKLGILFLAHYFRPPIAVDYFAIINFADSLLCRIGLLIVLHHQIMLMKVQITMLIKVFPYLQFIKVIFILLLQIIQSG